MPEQDITPVAPKARRYPRRRLTGAVTVHYSTRPKYPKLHLVEDCEGLEATPPEARDAATFHSVRSLATTDWARPCRMCALESVLITCGDPKPAQERKVFVTFTSQATPRNPDASPLSFDWHAATDSGIARLRRLARRLNLSVTGSCSGPVAYGMVNEDAAAAIAGNLRTVVRHDVVDVPSEAMIATLWTLLGDNPPELAEILGEEVDLDPWTAARLLSD